MAEWFYAKDNAQHGPASDLEIRSLISTGQIKQDTVIWREGMTDWLPLKEVQDFQPSQASNLQNPGMRNSSSETHSATPYATPQAQADRPVPGATIPTDGLAIASLVCGILAIVTCYLWGLFGIPAVICGHLSKKKMTASPTPIAGQGMATAGLVMGYIGIALQACVIIVFLVAFVGAASSSY